MTKTADISLVLESYNFDEGQDRNNFATRILDAAQRSINEGAELIITVTSSEALVLLRGLSLGPSTKILPVINSTYDDAKMRGAEAAHGTYVLFLDGDCTPVGANWISRMVEPVRQGRAIASGGAAIYPGGWLAKTLSIMDFGFLYETGDGEPLGCYASNNWAANRLAILDNPIPESHLRCNCYVHAQALLRAGRPMIFNRNVMVHHALPPFFKERWRRGYDIVAATWEDPLLRESQEKRSGWRGALAFYGENVRLDVRRAKASREILQIGSLLHSVMPAAFALFRLVDLAAISCALMRGGPRRVGAPAS